MSDILLTAIGVIGLYLFAGLRVLREYERGVYFLLGHLRPTKGPGLIFLPPLLAKMQKVSLRVMAIDIPPQDVITRDNISIKVNAVLYMRVKTPDKAVVGVENYLYATSQLAQTTLRSVLGETEMDELLANRDKINAILRQIIDVFYLPPARFYELAGLTHGRWWRARAARNPTHRHFVAQCLAPTLRMLEGYGLKPGR